VLVTSDQLPTVKLDEDSRLNPRAFVGQEKTTFVNATVAVTDGVGCITILSTPYATPVPFLCADMLNTTLGDVATKENPKRCHAKSV